MAKGRKLRCRVCGVRKAGRMGLCKPCKRSAAGSGSAMAGKMAGASLTAKALSAAAKARPVCPLGHGPGKPRAAHCVCCGSGLDFASPRTAAVNKAVNASRAGGGGPLTPGLYSGDPNERAIHWAILHPPGGQQGRQAS
jgi:hypothetical protein